MNTQNSNGRLETLTALRRNNYYYGKLMDVLHFEMEQSYVNRKRWLLNRLSLGEGVLCGLTVQVVNGELCVNPGVAIDGFGREIIVPTVACIDPWQLTDDCGKPQTALDPKATRQVTICLAYNECNTDYAPVMVADCNTREQAAAGTVVESYCLSIRDGVPASAPQGLGERACNSLFEIKEDRHKLLGAALDESCPAPPENSCIPLATVLLQDGTIGDPDCFTYRPMVYSNTVLLEMILCLAERIEECCANQNNEPTPADKLTRQPTDAPSDRISETRAMPPIHMVMLPHAELFNIVAVEFLDSQNQIKGSLGSDVQAPPFDSKLGISTIRVEFNKPYDITSVMAGGAGSDPRGFSFLVQASWSQRQEHFVPGSITQTAPTAAEFKPEDLALLPTGDYQVTLFGEVDPNGRRPTIISSIGDQLDAEATQLPSGNKFPGGNFTFKFSII